MSAKRFRLAFIGSLVTVLALSAAPADARNKGLFIGVVKFTNPAMGGSLPVDFDDANDLYNTTVSTGAIGANDGKVLVGAISKDDILEAIRTQGKNMGPGDTLFISVSTHGGKNGKFSATDAAVSGQEVAEALKASGCGQVLFINDSCHSEAFQIPPIEGKKIAQLHASGKDQTSTSSTAPLDGLDHTNGILTKHVIAGLEGAADKAGNGDGTLSMAELIAYVKRQVATESPQKAGGAGDTFDVPVGPPDPAYVRTIAVPDLYRMKSGEATALVKRYDLWPMWRPYTFKRGEWLPAAWADRVMNQNPARGTGKNKGDNVEFSCPPDKVVNVPTVVGRKVAEAQTALGGLGLKVAIENPAETTDHISFQSPNPGEPVVVGSWVTLRKSKDIEVPVLVGKTKPQATAALTGFGLVPDAVDENPPDTDIHPPALWEGTVWWASHRPKTKVTAGTQVRFKCAGKAVTVPPLGGKTKAAAQALLTPLGLGLNEGEPWYSDADPTMKDGDICDWSPQGDVYAGQTVTVRLIKFRTVPNIVGETAEGARKLCAKQELGFKVDRELIDGATDFDKVVRQRPAAGDPATRGDTVIGVMPLGTGEIHVAVVDKKTRTLLSDPTISLRGKGRRESVRAPSGKHTFAEVTPGPYTLAAVRRGYGTKSGSLTVDLKKKSKYRAVFRLEPRRPEDLLKVHTFDQHNKPAKKVKLGEAFRAQVRPADISDDHGKVGRVEWFIISPRGKMIPSSQARTGTEGLGLRVNTKKSWPPGKYGLIAIIHTEQGTLEARGGIVLESDRLRAVIGTPCYTGQWSRVTIPALSPDFLAKGALGLKVQGLPPFNNAKYWKLEGTEVWFRPIVDGQQRPAFLYGYNLAKEEERVECYSRVTVELTEMDVDIDWDKVDESKAKDFVVLTLRLPDSFLPNFVLTFPKAYVRLDPPVLAGKVYTWRGEIVLEDIPPKAKTILIDLTDSTGAIAKATIPVEKCQCERPPRPVKRVILKFRDKDLMARMAAALQDEDAAKAVAMEFARDMGVLCGWLGGLEGCEHLPKKTRAFFLYAARLFRKVEHGRLPTKAEGKRFGALARGLGRRPVKPGFMGGLWGTKK